VGADVVRGQLYPVGERDGHRTVDLAEGRGGDVARLDVLGDRAERDLLGLGSVDEAGDEVDARADGQEGCRDDQPTVDELLHADAPPRSTFGPRPRWPR